MTKVVNTKIQFNATNTMNVMMELLQNDCVPMVSFSTKPFGWRTNVINHSTLIVKIALNFNHQKEITRNAHAKTVSSLIQIHKFVMFSTIVSMAMLSKSPAPLDYISMSTVELACGLIQPTVKVANHQKVRKIHLIQLEWLRSPRFVYEFLIYSELAAELGTDEDEFRCPTTSTKSTDEKGQVVAHPKYPHPTDCQKFYVCLNGVDKRPLGCPSGQVYNDVTQMCDAPENVQGWFVLMFILCFVEHVKLAESSIYMCIVFLFLQRGLVQRRFRRRSIKKIEKISTVLSNLWLLPSNRLISICLFYFLRL